MTVELVLVEEDLDADGDGGPVVGAADGTGDEVPSEVAADVAAAGTGDGGEGVGSLLGLFSRTALVASASFKQPNRLLFGFGG